jgi:hypothetical protein
MHPHGFFGLDLETIEFPIETLEYFFKYPHLGLQHQSLLAVNLIL